MTTSLTNYNEVALIQYVMGAWVQSGDTFIDVGANAGSWAIAASAAVGESGCVVAFEPDFRVRKVLIERVNKLKLANVEIRSEAISSEVGVKTMWMRPDSELNGFEYAAMKSEDKNDWYKERIETTTIEEVLKSRKNRTIIKIDVEGHEFAVINGIGEQNRLIAGIIVEIHEPILQNIGVELDDICGMLKNIGLDNIQYFDNLHIIANNK